MRQAQQDVVRPVELLDDERRYGEWRIASDTGIPDPPLPAASTPSPS